MASATVRPSASMVKTRGFWVKVSSSPSSKSNTWAFEAIRSGAFDYITKPVRPKVFVSKVKALLKRAGGDRYEIFDAMPRQGP